jgi:hypothetical protein
MFKQRKSFLEGIQGEGGVEALIVSANSFVSVMHITAKSLLLSEDLGAVECNEK